MKQHQRSAPSRKACRTDRRRSSRRRKKFRACFEQVEDRRLLAADLALNVTDAGATVEPGGAIVYSFEYANTGDEAANGVLRTWIPRNTAFNAAGSTEGWICMEGKTTCSLDVGQIAAEANGVATFAVTVDADVSTRVRHVSISGTISGDDIRFDRNDHDGSSTPVIQQLHDLRLDLKVTESEVDPGESIVYTLDYSNQGVVAAPGPIISMRLPDHTSVNTDLSSEGWVCEEGTCSLSIGEVAAGAEGQVTLAVTIATDTPTSVRRMYATAQLADDGSGAGDANRWNNHDFAKVTVRHRVPDLSLKIDDGDVESVEAGGSLVYTLNYANQGLFDATGVVLTFKLPTSTTLDAANSSAGWTCEEGTCSLAVGNLGKDTTGTATLAVTVDAQLQNVRHLNAVASIADDGSAGEDANTRNNRDGERTAIAGASTHNPFGIFHWLRLWHAGRQR